MAIKPAIPIVAGPIRRKLDNMLLNKLSTAIMASLEPAEKARIIVYTVGNNR